MKIIINESKLKMAKSAAENGAALIRRTVSAKGHANILIATGASQLEMLGFLTKQDINWSVITCFHMDEYIDMPATHNASFRKYLKEMIVDIVHPKMFHFIDGEANTEEECRRVGQLITDNPIDISFIGIGENAHLAFNDPPADFETEEAFLKVRLDEKCRQQQYGEGWFQSFDDVPKIAISISIRQIMKASEIICTVPDLRKAEAVCRSIDGPVTPSVPASILQRHPRATLFLDSKSSRLLKTNTKNWQLTYTENPFRS